MDQEIKSKLNSLEYKLIDLEVKLNTILDLLEKDINPNCKKMSSHIDFVDKVYDNVKNPLGFICNKVNGLSGNNNYNLTDK
jgi:archaellum component FlaC